MTWARKWDWEVSALEEEYSGLQKKMTGQSRRHASVEVFQTISLKLTPSQRQKAKSGRVDFLEQYSTSNILQSTEKIKHLKNGLDCWFCCWKKTSRVNHENIHQKYSCSNVETSISKTRTITLKLKFIVRFYGEILLASLWIVSRHCFLLLFKLILCQYIILWINVLWTIQKHCWLCHLCNL